jgi:hypothetical protein
MGGPGATRSSLNTVIVADRLRHQPGPTATGRSCPVTAPDAEEGDPPLGTCRAVSLVVSSSGRGLISNQPPAPGILMLVCEPTGHSVVSWSMVATMESDAPGATTCQ